MIRVLHSVGFMHRAGVETMLMNYYRHIDRSRFQFDFLCHKRLLGDYDDEIRRLGGRLFYSPPLSYSQENEYKDFIKNLFYQESDIQILHAHNGAKQLFPLQAAKESRLPVRIAHAHGTNLVNDSRYAWKKSLINQIPDAASAFFACGTDAGLFFFGDSIWNKHGVVIKNGIELERFSYKPEIRNRLRSEKQLTGAHVIGNIGRFEEQKNHRRLIDIFSSVAKKDPLAVLVLIGTGKLEKEIHDKTVALGLDKRTLFLGSRDDVQDWYQAIDVFVMPSYFEGLPLTGIEAQASGLPCVFSDRISKELAITENVRFCSLSDTNELWGNVILESLENLKSRKSGEHQLKAAGYDINDCVAQLEAQYTNLCFQFSL